MNVTIGEERRKKFKVDRDERTLSNISILLRLIPLLLLPLQRQLLHHIPQHIHVHVARQLIQHEPLAQRPSIARRPHIHTAAHRLRLQHSQAQRSRRQTRAPIQHVQRRDRHQRHEPQPQHREDLLVQHVQRQHAQKVLQLRRAGRTDAIEIAFRHLRKDARRVHRPRTAIGLQQRPNGGRVARPEAIDHQMQHEHVGEDAQQVEAFAGHEANGVDGVQTAIVRVQILEDGDATLGVRFRFEGRVYIKGGGQREE